MGLHKNYLKVGQNASNHIFGLPKMHRGSTPISMLISYGAKFNSSEYIFEIYSWFSSSSSRAALNEFFYDAKKRAKSCCSKKNSPKRVWWWFSFTSLSFIIAVIIDFASQYNVNECGRQERKKKFKRENKTMRKIMPSDLWG